tara:strand:- start:9 stop:515 length:507 start_codon:yes stop_codon:yes gene_type:complete
MSTLSVDSINGQTVASKVSIPGHIVGAAVSQITANSSRGSAQSFDDDFVFANYTPKLTTSTVIIQGVANFDSANTAYCRYRWVINGANFFSTGVSTPIYTHQFYSNTSMNNNGYMPSTIITSVNNTDGSAITVKCQGMTNTGTLYRNRSANADETGSPSSVLYLEIAP